MIAARVGGIPEIFGPESPALFAASNADTMAEAIAAAIENEQATAQRASALRERISAHFSQQAMVDGVLAGYRDAFANH
jgi:glycosyltransferase involved in cell wall biosynthesis